MNYKVLTFFVLTVLLAGAACQTVTAPNTNASVKNGVTTDQKELPPGFPTNQPAPSGSPVPGIPADGVKNLPKGATPTPGIPADPGKPLPKGATPTPGIPDAETIKKQMNQKVDINTVNNPPPGGGDARPRRVEKP